MRAGTTGSAGPSQRTPQRHRARLRPATPVSPRATTPARQCRAAVDRRAPRPPASVRPAVLRRRRVRRRPASLPHACRQRGQAWSVPAPPPPAQAPASPGRLPAGPACGIGRGRWLRQRWRLASVAAKRPAAGWAGPSCASGGARRLRRANRHPAGRAPVCGRGLPQARNRARPAAVSVRRRAARWQHLAGLPAIRTPACAVRRRRLDPVWSAYRPVMRPRFAGPARSPSAPRRGPRLAAVRR